MTAEVGWRKGGWVARAEGKGKGENRRDQEEKRNKLKKPLRIC